jgi:hypothetical protein
MPQMPSLFHIGSYEMIVLQVLMLAGIMGALTAKAKGRSGFIWFVLTVASCGAAILVVLFLPVVKKKDPAGGDTPYEDGDSGSYDGDSDGGD